VKLKLTMKPVTVSPPMHEPVSRYEVQGMPRGEEVVILNINAGTSRPALWRVDRANQGASPRSTYKNPQEALAALQKEPI